MQNKGRTPNFEDVDGMMVSYHWELPFRGYTLCGREVEISVMPVIYDDMFYGINLVYECCGTHINGVWLDQFDDLNFELVPLLEARGLCEQSDSYDSPHELASEFLDSIVFFKKTYGDANA